MRPSPSTNPAPEPACGGSEKYWANTETGLLFNLICLGAFANPVMLLVRRAAGPTERDQHRLGFMLAGSHPIHDLVAVTQHDMRRPLFKSFQPTRPNQHDVDFVPAQPQHLRQKVAGVDVVLDDQDPRRYRGQGLASPGATLRVHLRWRAILTMNSLPQSRPPLRASTMPPCIDTIL